MKRLKLSNQIKSNSVKEPNTLYKLRFLLSNHTTCERLYKNSHKKIKLYKLEIN